MNDTLITENPPRRGVWGPWATAGFGAVTLIVFFVVNLVVMLIMAAIAIAYEPDLLGGGAGAVDFVQQYTGLLVSVATIASAVVCTGIIIAIIAARRGPGLAEYLGFRRTSVLSLVVLAAILVAFIAISTLISNAVNMGGDTSITVDIYNTAVWPALFWIAVVGFAPAFEEMFVRGFLFEGFRQSRLGPSWAIVITSIVWALLHIEYGWYAVGTIFVFGLVLGAIRYKTGSLWGTIFMHAAYNALVLLSISVGFP